MEVSAVEKDPRRAVPARVRRPLRGRRRARRTHQLCGRAQQGLCLGARLPVRQGLRHGRRVRLYRASRSEHRLPFIILFLVAALIVTCTTFQNLIQFFPSRGMTYLMTLHAIISLSVCICFFLCIKRLIDVFSLNLEQERNILASLYQEKEKREIINNDEKEINKLKENIRKELKQETEKKETA